MEGIGKFSDSRYETAMMLSDDCKNSRACMHCEGELFQFANIKCDYLFDFEPKNRREIRRMDSNWNKP